MYTQEIATVFDTASRSADMCIRVGAASISQGLWEKACAQLKYGSEWISVLKRCLSLTVAAREQVNVSLGGCDLSVVPGLFPNITVEPFWGLLVHAGIREHDPFTRRGDSERSLHQHLERIGCWHASYEYPLRTSSLRDVLDDMAPGNPEELAKRMVGRRVRKQVVPPDEPFNKVVECALRIDSGLHDFLQHHARLRTDGVSYLGRPLPRIHAGSRRIVRKEGW